MPSAAFAAQKLCVEFSSLKRASPKGIYAARTPDEPLAWAGVLFLHNGPYANAVLRFRIDFPEEYPERPPIITFLSDVFHPLVTPVTTYTHVSRNPGAETVSSADEGRLPPGGFTLRQGFPEWFENPSGTEGVKDHGSDSELVTSHQCRPHIVEVLQYIRVVFAVEAVLDSIPLSVAANSGAWHAWRSHRSSEANGRRPSATQGSRDNSVGSIERSTSPRQQPGGARKPGEWNWQGVWEDRVRKSVHGSNSDPMLFGAEGNDVISFLKLDRDAIGHIMPALSDWS